MTQKHFGSDKCTAEILMQASRRIGLSIVRDHGKRDTMKVADAIADVSINNAHGACDALRAMHEATGFENLSEWWSGKTNYEIAAFMRDVARSIAP